MNILHIVSAPAAGGAEIFVRDLARSMVEHGHSVHIGFLNHGEDVGRSIDYEQRYLDELRQAGVAYFFIGHKTRKLIWLGMTRVRNYAERHEIDVYHSHLLFGVVFGALIRVPRVFTQHSAKMRAGRLLFFFASKLVDRFVGISVICAQALSRHCGREVTTIFNGVDQRKLLVSSVGPRRVRKAVRCISVGRLYKAKNYELMIDAVALLPQKVRSRVDLTIAGEGPPRETANLEAKISDKGLEGNVNLIGNRDDIPELLADAQLFLMSSSREGLPISLIEASMSGLPCVVTDVGGCREVIERCQNGIVVESHNPKALANAIECIVMDPSLLFEYSANALRHSAWFSIGRSCIDHIALYHELHRPQVESMS